MTLPRLYPILDVDLLGRRGWRLRQAAGVLVEEGVRLLQVRHKGPFCRDVFEDVRSVASLCGEAGVRLILNDRADVAALLDCGVHVGQTDLPPVEARAIVGSSRWVGLSTHNAGQAAAAASEPVDYVALGPIFATSSKPNPDPEVGVANLRAWRGLVPQPLVAIGGITRATARQVLSAGADAIAVIADLWPEACEEAAVRARVREWLHQTAAPGK